MATIKELTEWINRDITRFGNTEQYALVDQEGPDEHGAQRFCVRIFTDTNQYTISAREPYEHPEGKEGDNGYLGCQGSTRKPRAGEEWTRGNDLSDGPLTEETWQAILGDIVSFEMVRVNRTDENSRVAVGVSVSDEDQEPTAAAD